MIGLASKDVPKMQTIHADICEVDFESSQFDAIIASYRSFHISADKHTDVFKRLHKWLHSTGKPLFTYATEEYTGKKSFDDYKNFVGQELYYSHKAPDELYVDLEDIGFNIDSVDHKNIGDGTFLWVAISKRLLSPLSRRYSIEARYSSLSELRLHKRSQTAHGGENISINLIIINHNAISLFKAGQNANNRHGIHFWYRA
jgi:hypothetical protein